MRDSSAKRSGAPIEATSGSGASASPRAAAESDGHLTAPTVSLVIHRFSSFGRVAHVRRWLLSLPQVTAARIESYGAGTVRFAIAVSPGTTASAVTVPGTRLVTCDGASVTLQVEGA